VCPGKQGPNHVLPLWCDHCAFYICVCGAPNVDQCSATRENNDASRPRRPLLAGRGVRVFGRPGLLARYTSSRRSNSQLLEAVSSSNARGSEDDLDESVSTEDERRKVARSSCGFRDCDSGDRQQDSVEGQSCRGAYKEQQHILSSRVRLRYLWRRRRAVRIRKTLAQRAGARNG